MTIRTLTTWQEWLEADRLLATAFLHPWNEEEATAAVKAQAEGTRPRHETTWGLVDDSGTLSAAITTLDHQMYCSGQLVGVGEFHMVGSRAESRGKGNVRTLMAEILAHFKSRGDVFATLIPFSASFYRKFGFELASHSLKQRVPIEQLANIPCDLRATHVDYEKDVAAVRSVYEDFARTRNLAPVRSDDAWRWRGNGEFGEPDFLLGDCRYDTYVLWRDDEPCAFMTFAFKHEPDMPFFGELIVTDLAYDGRESFLALLGLLYRLRAKAGYVTFDLCDDIDLATILPDGDKIEQTLRTYVMLRVLDVPRALELMPRPMQAEPWTVTVDDDFMPENSGTYRVSYGEETTSVERCDAAPDLRVSIQTLTLLASGRIGLDGALLRTGTQLQCNEELLRRVFQHRPTHLQL